MIEAALTALRTHATGASGRSTAGAPTDVEVLADVPGERLVLRCRLGRSRIVVRCVADDVATHQFRYLEALSSARSGVLRVPAPLALVPLATADTPRPMAALVLEHLDGIRCTDLVPAATATTRVAVDTMELAGRALAELHAIDPSGVPGLTLADTGDHLADLVRPFPDRLAAAVPDRGDVIERALHHVRTADAAAARHSAVVLHRDVHLRQLIRDGDHLGLVDWDLAARGDAAFDVAYLLTHLDTHVDDAAPLCRAVLRGYGDPSMTAERLAPYRSFNLLRRACRRYRLRDLGWEAEMERMLRELARSLDAAGVPA